MAAGFAAAAIRVPDLDAAYTVTGSTVADVEALSGPQRLAPGAGVKADWHNARVALNMALNTALADAPNDAAREALLAKLTDVLSEQGDLTQSPTP